MDKLYEQTMLFDFYGELLTEHQRRIYADAVYNDMSLSEIAEEQGISRQGVHDLIRRCDRILQDYESRLHLVERFARAKETVKEIQELSAETVKEIQEPSVKPDGIPGAGERAVLKSKLEKIGELSRKLIQEL